MSVLPSRSSGSHRDSPAHHHPHRAAVPALVVLAPGGIRRWPARPVLLSRRHPVGINVDLREFVVEIPQQTSSPRTTRRSDRLPDLPKVMEEQAADSSSDPELPDRRHGHRDHDAQRRDRRHPPRRRAASATDQRGPATKLDEVTQRWGVKVTTVEIRELTPPRDVQEAMNAAHRGTHAARISDRARASALRILVAEATSSRTSSRPRTDGITDPPGRRASPLALDKINEMRITPPRTITLQSPRGAEGARRVAVDEWIIRLIRLPPRPRGIRARDAGQREEGAALTALLFPLAPAPNPLYAAKPFPRTGPLARGALVPGARRSPAP